MVTAQSASTGGPGAGPETGAAGRRDGDAKGPRPGDSKAVPARPESMSGNVTPISHSGGESVDHLTSPLPAPACRPKAGSGRAEDGEQGKALMNEQQDNGITGLKVMVIDDSKTIRRTAESLLTKAGCEVITATDGFEALAKIVDHQPDIIFVDIMMPRLDGYQTCALIKNNGDFSGTPVIMLSSKDGLFDRARGRIVGSEQYLTKPFTRDELLGAIRTHALKPA